LHSPSKQPIFEEFEENLKSSTYTLNSDQKNNNLSIKTLSDDFNIPVVDENEECLNYD